MWFIFFARKFVGVLLQKAADIPKMIAVLRLLILYTMIMSIKDEER